MKESKSLYNADKENSIFAQRLRALFNETQKTQQDLIDFIQLKTGKAPTRQAVSMWLHGNSPDIKTVPIIANFFGVSTDYLLTEKGVRTTNPKVTEVCEYTGLSEKAVEFLHDLRSRANGDEAALKKLVVIHTLEQKYNYCTNELETLLKKYPELKTIVDDFRNTQHIDYKSFDDPKYKDVLRCLMILDETNSELKTFKGRLVNESKFSLEALSELLSDTQRAEFASNLALYLYTDFNSRDTLSIGVSDDENDDNRAGWRWRSFPAEIIGDSLLAKIQNYIRGLKPEKTVAFFRDIKIVDIPHDNDKNNEDGDPNG